MTQQIRDRSDVRKEVVVEEELSEGISVRLTPSVLRQLRTQAKTLGIGPSTLARMWILERLADSEGGFARKAP